MDRKVGRNLKKIKNGLLSSPPPPCKIRAGCSPDRAFLICIGERYSLLPRIIITSKPLSANSIKRCLVSQRTTRTPTDNRYQIDELSSEICLNKQIIKNMKKVHNLKWLKKCAMMYIRLNLNIILPLCL